MSDETAVRLMDGKYELRHENGRNFRALRYGEPWRDLTGDGMVLALVQRIEELEEATTLRQAPAQGRVTEAMVDDLRKALEAANKPLLTDKAEQRAAWLAVSFMQDHGAALEAALEAALSAQQGQGDGQAYMAGYVQGCNDQACTALNQYELREDAMRAADHAGYLTDTAPPAQPAEPFIADAIERLRVALGELSADADPLAVVSLAEVRIRRLQAAQPAERVPEGWRLVPIKWTPEMRIAGAEALKKNATFEVRIGGGIQGFGCGTKTTKRSDNLMKAAKCWDAMLAASPAPSPARGDGGEG